MQLILVYEVCESEYVRTYHGIQDHFNNQGEEEKVLVDEYATSLPLHTATSQAKHKKMLSSVSGCILGLDYTHEVEREDSLSFLNKGMITNDQNLKLRIAQEALNIINVNLLSSLPVIVTLAPILVELEIAISVSFLPVCIGFVDLRRLG
jgi:hypothetical protein